MSHSELLEQLQQLSRADKFQMMQFLLAELAKGEGLSLGNETGAIMAGVHTSNSGAAQLMQLLEMEKEQPQNPATNEKISLRDAAEMMRSYYAKGSNLTEFVDDCPEDFYEYQDYA
ncbi:hypothetical protein [Spirulina sp. 06S082]|uniref:hypothetical protein n=1 Tax=Spirulina sp. 06S082 TaxID=3110248 RepID=UPI002B1F6B95|nr:hypothetical protein [Spirulina sp. 06S082]MEA5471642.1 hypothetical protein [Spirulina sp. 06S082]